ncbi:hypothetical protein ACFX11_032026 [Malus domestica]
MPYEQNRTDAIDDVGREKRTTSEMVEREFMGTMKQPSTNQCLSICSTLETSKTMSSLWSRRCIEAGIEVSVT